MKLADVFWKAANEHLSVGPSTPLLSQYTCVAVSAAIYSIDQRGLVSLRLAAMKKAEDYMKALGCETGRMNYTFGTKHIAERQQRRYMWLLIAMHAAEDEGIEV